MITKFYASNAMETLADKRQVRVICSTASVDRDGDIIVQAGINTAPYMASGAGPVLWNHNPNSPIAKCVEIGLMNGNLTALVQFPPAGDDPEADRYYGKIKFGSVAGVSIGFLPIASEPVDRGNQKKGPQKYTSCELMEFSFTPVQSNRGAMVSAKSGTMTDDDARKRRLRQVDVYAASTPHRFFSCGNLRPIFGRQMSSPKST